MLQVSTARIPHRILYVNNMPASRDKDAQSAANTQIMTITDNYVCCRQRITLNVLYTVWGRKWGSKWNGSDAEQK